MDLKKYKKSNENIEIDLLNYCLHILFRWRLCIIVSLIMMVLFGAMKYVSNLSHNKVVARLGDEEAVEMNDLISEEEKQLIRKKAKDILTTEELSSVESLVNQYYQYFAKKDYENNSIYYNLDANNVYRRTITYLVDTDYKINYTQNVKKDEVNSIITSYISYINSLGSLDGFDQDMKYIQEVVEVERTGVEKSQELDSKYSINSEDEWTFTMSVKGASEDEVNRLANALDTDLYSYKKNLDAQLGGHELKRINDEVAVIRDEELLNKKIELSTEVKGYIDGINQELEDFSVYQAVAFYYNVKEKIPESTLTFQDVIEKNSIYTSSKRVLKNPYSVNPQNGVFKFVMIGFVVGLIVCYIYIFLMYLFDGTIKTTSELEKLGFYIIGNLSYLKSSEKENCIDKFVKRLANPESVSFENEIRVSAEHIVKICEKENVQSLILATSENMSDDLKALINELTKLLKSSGLDALAFDGFNHNIEAIKSVSDQSSIILVEKIAKTKNQQLYRSIDMCCEQGANILGIVVA